MKSLDLIPDDIWTRRTGSLEHNQITNACIAKVNELENRVYLLESENRLLEARLNNVESRFSATNSVRYGNTP